MSYLSNVKNVDTTIASNISSGTLADARLSANVTLQGNVFNGANQLVQLNSSAQLPIANMATAAFFQQGRLTDTTVTPNGGNSSSGSVTLYFTPSHQGNSITLFNTSSSTWITQTFNEVSTSMAITAGNYDVYIASASALTVTMSLVAWINDTTPPTRSSQNGRLVKNGAANNLLVGIIRTDGTKTYSWLGSRWIINFYNAINLSLLAQQTSATSYTFAGSTSIVAANSNTTDGIGRFSALFDIAINQNINLENYQSVASVTGASNGHAYQIGIAVDTTSTNKSYGAVALQVSNGLIGSIVNLPIVASCKYVSNGLSGYHFFQRTESLSASGATVTLTLANATFGQGGLMQAMIIG